MKKLLFLAITAAGLCGCNPNKYVIDGNIEGLDEYVYLSDQDGNRIDSVKAQNGAFRFKGVAEQPDYFYVSTDGGSEHNLRVIVFSEPGKIAVTGNIEEFLDIYPSGTPANDGYADYLRKSRKLIKQFRNDMARDNVRKAYERDQLALGREALAANQNNFFGAMLLSMQLGEQLPASETLGAIAKFPENIRKTPLVIRTKSEALSRQKTEPGQPYINIVQNDPEGKPFGLKQVIENPVNKYVLVDFWASWCPPCMFEVPFLVKYYDQYHKKGFDIFGVSLDSDKAAWTKTIAEKKMNWAQVSGLNRFANQAVQDYGIRSIPSSFLIDCSTGKIIAVNLRGDALGEKLAELLD